MQFCSYCITTLWVIFLPILACSNLMIFNLIIIQCITINTNNLVYMHNERCIVDSVQLKRLVRYEPMKYGSKGLNGWTNECLLR